MKIKIDYIDSAYSYHMMKFDHITMSETNKIITKEGPILMNLGGRSIPF